MKRFRVATLVIVACAAVSLVTPAVAAPPPSVSNLTVTPTPNLASHKATYTITFKTSPGGALVPGDTITLKFPSGTVPGTFCGDVGAFTNNITVNASVTSVSAIIFCLEVRVAVPVAIGGNTNVTMVVGSTTPVVRNPGAGKFAMKVHTTKDFTDAGSKKYTIAAQHAPLAAGPVLPQITDEDVALPITLTGTDSDGDPLTFSIVTVPAHGVLGPLGLPACGGGGCTAAVTYTPTGNYDDADTFTFRVNDGIVSSAVRIVNISMTPINDDPVAQSDDVTVAQDSGPTAINVLANDSDVDGDVLTITTPAPATSNGTATCGATSCTYTPNAGFSGNDSFDYTITDGTATDSATVHVEVTPAGGGPGGGTATFELCATTGNVTMPDSTVVPIWGFVEGDCDAVAGTATLPGPVLPVDAGNEVHITLDNGLGANVSLELLGLDIAPDPVGTAPSTEKEYVFTASRPGTYLYEAGGHRQVLMGLYGALVVRPSAAGQAYDGAGTAFDGVDHVLVLSEVDPLFNASPDTFNLVGYAPKYWLINGRAYPDTAAFTASAGDRVLLRYVNAGSMHHTIALLGMHERVIGRDADPVRYPYEVDSETIATGSTLDAIATVPATAASGDRFAVYNRQLHLDNMGAFPGGMLTFIDVP